MNSLKTTKAMTIIELTIVMVISAVVLFVAMQGFGIVQRLTIMQTHEIIESNTLFNDYLLFETVITSSDSVVYSENSAVVFFNNKQMHISNMDSIAIFDRDTLFKTAHKITYARKSSSDTLVVKITSPDIETEFSFLLAQHIRNTRENEIERTEATYIYFEE